MKIKNLRMPAILLVGLLLGATFLYNKYSDEYFNQETEQQSDNISIETTETVFYLCFYSPGPVTMTLPRFQV